MNDILCRIKLLFHKDKELYYDLKKIIGFFPGDIELYKTALMHKSVMHRNEKGKPVNNERLEFLGDAILGAVVGYIVYEHFPGKREGFLTNTRSKLVQREMLGKLAKEMGVTKLILSSGRNQTHNSYMGGNAFEALVGAIYLDKGYNACMKFVEKKILKNLVNIDKVAYKEVNFKSKLLEWTQKNRINIDFQLVESTKDENSNPVFVYKIMLETVECCTAKGYTKKESQQQAAKLTLEKLRKNKKFEESIFAAKSERTKMEEESVFLVPETPETTEAPELQSKAAPQPKPADTTTPQPQSKAEPQPKPRRQSRKTKDDDAVKEEKKVSEDAAKETAAKAEKKEEAPKAKREPRKNSRKESKESAPKAEKPNLDTPADDFDLSDITGRAPSREEIIAAAEKAAFEEQNGEKES